ncbi:hypothetical protein Vretimale_2817, partial [Volvox reticuliferus]
ARTGADNADRARKRGGAAAPAVQGPSTGATAANGMGSVISDIMASEQAVSEREDQAAETVGERTAGSSSSSSSACQCPPVRLECLGTQSRTGVASIELAIEWPPPLLSAAPLMAAKSGNGSAAPAWAMEWDSAATDNEDDGDFGGDGQGLGTAGRVGGDSSASAANKGATSSRESGTGGMGGGMSGGHLLVGGFRGPDFLAMVLSPDAAELMRVTACGGWRRTHAIHVADSGQITFAYVSSGTSSARGGSLIRVVRRGGDGGTGGSGGCRGSGLSSGVGGCQAPERRQPLVPSSAPCLMTPNYYSERQSSTESTAAGSTLPGVGGGQLDVVGLLLGAAVLPDRPAAVANQEGPRREAQDCPAGSRATSSAPTAGLGVRSSDARPSSMPRSLHVGHHGREILCVCVLPGLRLPSPTSQAPQQNQSLGHLTSPLRPTPP